MARSGSLYGAYVFQRKEKDPSIDVYRTLAQDYFGRRNITHKDMVAINEAGGPSVSCVNQWLYGKTLRPTNAAMEAAGRALGYQRVWQRMRKNSQ
jgi:hypothetical protein